MLHINKIYEDAEIGDDARLYRITSPTYATKSTLLNGRGANSGDGRFHVIQQLTSYSADNVLICIAEKLFYMHYISLRKLSNNSYPEFKREATKKHVLSVFKCENIQDFIYVESSVARQNYQLNPSTVTYPDRIYAPLQTAGNKMRRANKNGIMYPSARHSQGLSVCFFGDQTNNIKSLEANIQLTLSLVSEDMTTLADDINFDPTSARISNSIGHFSFDDSDFRQYSNLLSPNLSSKDGYIDFHRIFYVHANYPSCAIK